MNSSSPGLIRAIRQPIMLITIGVLFALDHMTEFSFGRTWPAILIVLGLLSLGEQFTGSKPPDVASRRDPDFFDRAVGDGRARRVGHGTGDASDIPFPKCEAAGKPTKKPQA